MADDFSKLIKKKSIFSKLGVVDYFTGTQGITKEAPPDGFTQKFTNKDDSKFLVKQGDINYASLANFALAPISWNVSTFSLSTQLKYNGTADTLHFKTFPNGFTLDMYYKRSSFLNDPLSIHANGPQPFITRNIGTRFGFNNQQSAINILDGMVSPYRAGIATMLDIVSTDVTRLTKFMSTTKGLSFLGKQVGMQLMNPRPETRIYNPLSIFGSIGGALLGFHQQRHTSLFGLLGTDNYSSTDGVKIDSSGTDYVGTNRLIRFTNRFFNNSLPSNLLPVETSTLPGVSIAQYSIFGLQLTNPYLWQSGFYIPPQVRTPNGIKNTVDSGIAQVPYKFNRHSDYTRMATDRQDLGRYSKKLQDNPNNTTLARLLSGEDYPVQYTNYKIEYDDPIKPDSGIGTSGWDITTLNFSPYDSADPTITFRAIIDTYSDAWSPSYTTINYVGNPITYPVYQNTRRTISIGFKVPIYFQSELGIVQGKLNQISSYTYPAQVKGTHRIATPYMIFKFGTFIQRVVGVISTLTYTVDSTTPWVSTTNNATEYPLVVSVALNIDVVPEGIPVAYYLKNVHYTVQNKTVVRPPIVPPKSIPYTPPIGDNGRVKTQL